MTDFYKLLRELKNIKADPDYTARSRVYFVAGTAEPAFARATADKPARQLSVWQILSRSFQTSSAIVLTGILMLMALGGFSAWQFFSPVKLASLDPAGIRAEAQAIDIQIKLTDLNYAESLNPTLTQETSTVFTATGNPKPSFQPTTHPASPQTSAPVSSTEPLSIDQTLDRLSQ